MGDALPALIAVLVAIVLVILFAKLRWTSIKQDERCLPAELRGAEVAYAEVTFKSHSRRLVAKLDRAYRTTAGVQLVELKTRQSDVVYQSDVIELSVQRIALADETGEAVLSEALVVVQNSRTGGRRPHKVRLMDPADIMAMRERYVDVVQGRVARPAAARSLSLCSECAHRARCRAKFGQRA